MESVLRQLCDKSYERRRQAAAELQKNIKQNLDMQNYAAIHKLIEQFKDDYLDNQNEVYKKAGLIAFSAIAIALSEYSNSTEFYTSIIIPVVGCFRDFAATVRYASIEAMYNIVKVLRSEILPFFPNIFRGMIELFADVDTDVRRAAQQLDSILKSIIVESEADPTIFDSEKFMSLIYDMVKGARNPSVQQMLVSWLLVLDSIPSFDLLYYLPNFIEGFFLMLASQNKDVKQSVFNCLKDFLEEIKCSKRIAEMKTLIGHMVQLSTHSESFVRSVANTWINELLAECPLELASQFPNCLQAILKFLSDSEKQIVDLADKTNTAMIQYIEEIFRENEASRINFEYLVEVLMDHIDHPSMKTSKAVLDWIAKLQVVCPDSIKTSLDHILETLTTRLRDPHESVIQQALEVLCTIAGYEGYFNKVISSVVRMFENNSDLMTQQGAAIIRTLCSSLGVERVYSCFAEVLYDEPASSFVKRMIELLNELLLTDEGFESLRERLKYCLERDDKECLELFEKMFCTWSISPGSTLTLTFLAQAYKLSYNLLHILSRCKIEPELLIQLAKLVHLIESPIFVHLRMQMLEHHRHPYLLKSLYAISMFLPQSKAFHVLMLRLKNISTLHKMSSASEEKIKSNMSLLHYSSLIQNFIDRNMPTELRKTHSNLMGTLNSE